MKVLEELGQNSSQIPTLYAYFVEDNIQGMSFEPWHWRYVASNQANSILNAP